MEGSGSKRKLDLGSDLMSGDKKFSDRPIVSCTDGTADNCICAGAT